MGFIDFEQAGRISEECVVIVSHSKYCDITMRTRRGQRTKKWHNVGDKVCVFLRTHDFFKREKFQVVC